MKNITIYHNPKCSTSRDILDALQKKGYSVQIIEYLKNPPKKNELKEILQLSGLKPSDLLRKKETLAKDLIESGKLQTENEILEAMIEHPVLIERPILKSQNWAALARPKVDFITKIEQGEL